MKRVNLGLLAGVFWIVCTTGQSQPPATLGSANLRFEGFVPALADGARCYLDGQQIPNAVLETGSVVPVPNLRPGAIYQYRVEVRFRNASAIARDYRFQNGDTVVIRFSDVQAGNPPAPAFALPPPTVVATRLTDDQIPMVFRTNNLTTLYREYREAARVPTLQELRPGNRQGYECHLNSLSPGGARSERRIFFESVTTQGGRSVRLRIEDPERNAANLFRLERGASSWSGFSTSAIDTTDFEAVTLINHFRLGFRGPGAYRFGTSTPTVAGNRYRYACIRASRENNHELYIEMGHRIQFSFTDNDGAHVTEPSADIRFFTSPNERLGWSLSPGTIFREAPRLMNVASLPPSSCLTDLPDGFVFHRMDTLGTCEERLD